jgi:hypothetical protein
MWSFFMNTAWMHCSETQPLRITPCGGRGARSMADIPSVKSAEESTVILGERRSRHQEL